MALLNVEMLRDRDIPVTFLAGDSGDNPMFAERKVPVIALEEQTLLDAGLGSAALRGLHNPRGLRVIGEWIKDHDDPNTV